MADLTGNELVDGRRFLAKGAHPSWNKPQINAALQGANAQFPSIKTILGTAIETASPGVFNANQKKAIAKVLFSIKFKEI